MRVSQAELSRLTGIGHRTLAKKLADVPYLLGQRQAKMYEAHEALPVIYGSEGPAQSAEAGLTDARIAFEKARTEEMHLRIAERKGELVPIGPLLDDVRAMVNAAKARY